VRIVTWNVNSVRARLPRVTAWLLRHRPDLVCIQETKVQDADFPRLEMEALGYAVEIHGQKAYNGVALLSRMDLRDVTRGFGDLDDTEKRVIAATVGGIRVMNLYVPNGEAVGSAKYARKLHWLDRFGEILSERHRTDEPLLLCGDFNIAPEDRDVHDPKRWRDKVLCSEPERERFRALVGWGLTDALRHLTPEGGIYTWWDYRLNGFPRNWGLRIDHFLVTAPVLSRVRTVTVDRDERGGEKPSDHAPVVLELE
jgi:exodeoxyribonuclease-3